MCSVQEGGAERAGSGGCDLSSRGEEVVSGWTRGALWCGGCVLVFTVVGWAGLLGVVL